MILKFYWKIISIKVKCKLLFDCPDNISNPIVYSFKRIIFKHFNFKERKIKDVVVVQIVGAQWYE